MFEKWSEHYWSIFRFFNLKKNHLDDGLYSSRQVNELKALNPIFYISCVNIVLLTKLVLSRTFSNDWTAVSVLTVKTSSVIDPDQTPDANRRWAVSAVSLLPSSPVTSQHPDQAPDNHAPAVPPTWFYSVQRRWLGRKETIIIYSFGGSMLF